MSIPNAFRPVCGAAGGLPPGLVLLDEVNVPPADVETTVYSLLVEPFGSTGTTARIAARFPAPYTATGTGVPCGVGTWTSQPGDLFFFARPSRLDKVFCYVGGTIYPSGQFTAGVWMQYADNILTSSGGTNMSLTPWAASDIKAKNIQVRQVPGLSWYFGGLKFSTLGVDLVLEPARLGQTDGLAVFEYGKFSQFIAFSQ